MVVIGSKNPDQPFSSQMGQFHYYWKNSKTTEKYENLKNKYVNEYMGRLKTNIVHVDGVGEVLKLHEECDTVGWTESLSEEVLESFGRLRVSGFQPARPCYPEPKCLDEVADDRTQMAIYSETIRGEDDQELINEKLAPFSKGTVNYSYFSIDFLLNVNMVLGCFITDAISFKTPQKYVYFGHHFGKLEKFFDYQNESIIKKFSLPEYKPALVELDNTFTTGGGLSRLKYEKGSVFTNVKGADFEGADTFVLDLDGVNPSKFKTEADASFLAYDLVRTFLWSAKEGSDLVVFGNYMCYKGTQEMWAFFSLFFERYKYMIPEVSDFATGRYAMCFRNKRKFSDDVFIFLARTQVDMCRFTQVLQFDHPEKRDVVMARFFGKEELRLALKSVLVFSHFAKVMTSFYVWEHVQVVSHYALGRSLTSTEKDVNDKFLDYAKFNHLSRFLSLSIEQRKVEFEKKLASINDGSTNEDCEQLKEEIKTELLNVPLGGHSLKLIREDFYEIVGLNLIEDPLSKAEIVLETILQASYLNGDSEMKINEKTKINGVHLVTWFEILKARDRKSVV